MIVLLLIGTTQALGDESPPEKSGLVREIRFGVAAHDVDQLWSQESKEKGPSVTAALIWGHELLSLFGATAYPCIGATLNTRGDTSKVTGGFLLEWEPHPLFSVAAGFGLALHNGERDTEATDRKSLGSSLLFWIPFEVGYAINRHHRIVLTFDHVSNANLASPNEGMDTVGLAYGYRF